MYFKVDYTFNGCNLLVYNLSNSSESSSYTINGFSNAPSNVVCFPFSFDIDIDESYDDGLYDCYVTLYNFQYDLLSDYLPLYTLNYSVLSTNYDFATYEYVTDINENTIKDLDVEDLQSPFFYMSFSVGIENADLTSYIESYAEEQYNLGFNVGYTKAVSQGQTISQETNREWYNAGYQEGYRVGVAEGSNQTFSGVFGLIGDAFSSTSSLMNVNVIGGLTIGGLIGIPLAITIVITLFKMMRK